jgi:hypothetical protein
MSDAGKIGVISLEEYLPQNGAGSIYGDPGLHRSSESMGKKTWNRLVEAQRKKDNATEAKRLMLTEQYNKKVEAGELRPPNYIEGLLATANGHPDNESTQAARRLLKKRGLTWED